MKPLYRGLLVGVVQCAMVLSMTAKYEWDRERLPRVWAKVVPVDPSAPLRGRYLQLRLEVIMDGAPLGTVPEHVRLALQNGQLTAKPDDTGALLVWNSRGRITLQQLVAFFLPDTMADPSRLKAGEEFWVEVSLPPNAMPRPVRLGIKKDNMLTPLNLK